MSVTAALGLTVLCLVTEELLIEAHEVEEKPIATLVLFGGFLTFWAIQLMGHQDRFLSLGHFGAEAPRAR